MCTNLKRVYCPSVHGFMYVKCGKCPACQTEKANARLRRIKNAAGGTGELVLFVTLTYTNNFLPYIKPSELKTKMEYLNIYRDYDVRKVRKFEDYSQAYKITENKMPIAKIDCFEQKLYFQREKLPRAHGARNKIGILYFKDLQDFYKRLERNLFRHYGIVGSDYKRYSVSEYGETYLRPHFHLLLYIKAKDLVKFESAIRESWPFDNQNLARQIEIARNASSYVSKYLCRGSNFPKLFENRSFRPKNSFSKGFGLSHPSFTLPSLLKAIDSGSLQYSVLSLRKGCSEVVDLLFPKYFINRYFFKFKRYSRLTFDTFSELISEPCLIDSVGEYLGYTRDSEKDDFDDFKRCIRLRFQRFCNESGFRGSTECLLKLFIYYYWRVWTVYNSNIYKLLVTSSVTLEEHLENYDNLEEVRSFNIKSDLRSVIDSHPSISNPNLFVSNIKRTFALEDDYFKHMKRKKVNNHIYRKNGMNI